MERLRYSNGREYDIDFVRHPGAAAVVAVDATAAGCASCVNTATASKIFCGRFPRGKLDPGEAPAACAHRELAEETGVTAKRWTELGLYIPAPGLFTEVIHLYLARDLEVGASQPDADEELELQWLPFAEALAKVQRGEWNDGKTAHGLLRANTKCNCDGPPEN